MTKYQMNAFFRAKERDKYNPEKNKIFKYLIQNKLITL